ncbi:acyl dehydratase, partial [Pseudomonas aeruginosa]|nr:acyl dehydratase [Pseudomonas aeruginosa]
MPTAWLDLPAPPALPCPCLPAARRRGIRDHALPGRGLCPPVAPAPLR